MGGGCWRREKDVKREEISRLPGRRWGVDERKCGFVLSNLKKVAWFYWGSETTLPAYTNRLVSLWFSTPLSPCTLSNFRASKTAVRSHTRAHKYQTGAQAQLRGKHFNANFGLPDWE